MKGEGKREGKRNICLHALYIGWTAGALRGLHEGNHEVHVLMRDEKKERSKQGQTNNKAKQHSTPKAVTFPKKNELSRVGLEPTTLYTLDRALYH